MIPTNPFPITPDMKVNMEFDLLSIDANILGEMLRDRYFDQNRNGDVNSYSFGCYSTFDIRNLPHTNLSHEEAVRYVRLDPEEAAYVKPTAYRFLETTVSSVVMAYYWDGDGYLMFVLESCGVPVRVISNSDCKKDYVWRDDSSSLEELKS